jgi:aminopeptidase N
MHKLIIVFLLFCACTGRSQTKPFLEGGSGGTLSPEQENMDIRHYRIVLDVDPAEKSIRGYSETKLQLKKAAHSILFQLYSNYKVSGAWVNNQPVSFSHIAGQIMLFKNDAHFSAGIQHVKIAYSGRPRVAPSPPWKGGFTWSKDKNGKPWVAITCQLEGAQIYFPCKDHPSDEPNEGADLEITVPAGLTVAGPGLLIATTSEGGRTRFHWQTKYTINNYGIVFNVGDFALVQRTYTTVAGNNVPMQFYVLRQDSAKANSLLNAMERSCRVLEKYFGEYPWVKEKIGLCQTPHLGMEHQTLNAYGNKFKFSKVNGYDHDWLMHHEFGHEWWANKVSNADWAHMWIQEGICSFGDALYYREIAGEAAYKKRMKSTGRNAANDWPIVQGDTVDSDKAYHGDIYGKGAFFMHSLRCVMGDSLLFAAVKELATNPATTYDNMITTKDVEDLFSRMAGKDLGPYFNLFLRTTEKLKVLVRKTGPNQYFLQLKNLDMALPMDIQISGGIKRLEVTPAGITVQSDTKPKADPDGFYLLHVVEE